MPRQNSVVEPPGLTTNQAPFIERAQAAGEIFIHQPYELYSEENHEAWRRLFAAMTPRWGRYANRHFLEGIDSLCLDPLHVPKLDDVNKFLRPLTGFQAKAVSGYIPSFLFFDCLRNRSFSYHHYHPAVRQARLSARARHFSRRRRPCPYAYGQSLCRDAGALRRMPRTTAAELVAGIRDEAERTRRLTSIIRAMARFFWFTVEFGLMRSPDGLRAYGSGLLSSFGEIEHAIDSPEVQRYPIQLEWAINQAFEIDHYQPLLFIVDSFDHLFTLVDELERWLRDGKLNNVEPGEPVVNERDLKSFLLRA